jgi:Kef-type K+ transport system membrane component KefB
VTESLSKPRNKADLSLGWILLALCVALVNAGSGLAALWVLLTCAAYMLFLIYLVRPAFIYILRRSRALQDGPSQGIISLTLLIALGSAFFTGIIGVHPIFGAFMAGLICPHEGGFAIKVAEKIEDLIGALFLPLYFTLSGLNTNIGLLDSGIVWAYVVGVIVVAFLSKFIGATLAARSTKMLWRECFAIGSLMSCKGLVELIVLVSHCSLVQVFSVSNLCRTLASTQGFSAPAHSPSSSSWLLSLPSPRPR